MDGNRQTGFHYTACGLDSVWLANGVEFHETPYGKGYSIRNLDGLHDAIGLGLIEKAGKLSGPEIRFLRHELDWSQAALAFAMGVTDQTVARWEKGQVPIAEPEQRLLAGLYREHVTGTAGLQAQIERIAKLDAEIHADLMLRLENEDWALCA